MTTNHTPTPWALDRKRSKLTDADGEHVTRVDLTRYVDERRDLIAEANAAFIVTACNAHDELVAALHGLLSLTRLRDGIGEYERRHVEQARAALAKVTP